MKLDARAWVAALVALIAGGLFGAVIVETNDDGAGHKTRTVRVEVGKTSSTALPEGVTIDKNTTLSTTEQKADAAKPFSVDPHAVPLANAGPDIHEDQVDETPPGISSEESAEAKVTPDGLVKPLPPAGAQNYTLTRNLVRNYSERAPGTKVSMFCIHFTVSRPGSLAQIRNLFNTPSFGASSHIGLELDGEAELWVPFSKKAWTEGAFNSVCDSVEIVTNDLSRTQWLATPIFKKGILASIVRDRARVRGIPLRLVDPVGCTPKAGITDHSRLECGNTHWDVGKNFPWDVLLRQARGGDAKAAALRKAKRSHRIVHAKLAKRCRGKHTSGCTALRQRNRSLHSKYPSL